MGHPNLFFSGGKRHDPDVGRLCVGLEIHINHAEDHPLAVRRDFRLTHALEFHHVFKSERKLGWSAVRGRGCAQSKKSQEEPAHEDLRGKRKSVAGRSSSFLASRWPSRLTREGRAKGSPGAHRNLQNRWYCAWPEWRRGRGRWPRFARRALQWDGPERGVRRRFLETRALPLLRREGYVLQRP